MMRIISYTLEMQGADNSRDLTARGGAMPNRLAEAKSPYLRKAAGQPVDWIEWGDEAFDQAKKRDCPILLSIGGVWCHWCHVMAHESFEDAEIAGIINERYVPVKVDRDERPDIDRRYQDAVMRITGNGGWPLTAFLTPEGKIFFGGTYFPPNDRLERPGFKTLLLKLSELYRNDRERIEEAAAELYKNMLNEASMDMKSESDETIISRGIDATLSVMDTNYGGLGKAPKFHHASAFEFLMNYNYFARDGFISKAITEALDAMARGGVYDHLLGGFFRYSTDERWMVPHFEKMLYDNAELLKLYSIGYKVFGKELYSSTARGIVAYYKKYGCDADSGFYASQDADIGVLDEGGAYTFSPAELAPILTPDEFKAITLYFGIGTIGTVHHDPSKSVLFLDKEPDQIASAMKLPVSDVAGLIQSAKDKMLGYREEMREMPYIDKTIYTNWNGLMIEALCIAGNMLGADEYTGMAEKAARRVLDDYYDGGSIMHRQGVRGFSEDYIFFARGLMELFQSIQKEEYVLISRALIDKAIKLFWDKEHWGFFDAEPGGQGYLEIGVKNIQDSPVQSANGIAPLLLMQLADATGDDRYVDYAGKTLKAFAALAEGYPTLSYSYLTSRHAFQTGTFKVETSEFFGQALKDFRPYKLVINKEIEGVLVCEKNACRKYDSYPIA
jgi:uncharacterized protein YyaL (SSP411 family)